MDAEFVDFLDKKFQGVSQEIGTVRSELLAFHTNVEHGFAEIHKGLRELQKAVTTLTNEVNLTPALRPGHLGRFAPSGAGSAGRSSRFTPGLTAGALAEAG